MDSEGQREAYDRYYRKTYLDWSFNVRGKARSFSAIARLAGLQMNRVDVLDIGFGAGAMLLCFDPSSRIIGLDYSRTAVDRMRRLAKRRGFQDSHFKTWDGMHTPLPYPEASFDVVIASHILEHLADDGVMIAEARRLLRVGGHLVVMVPLDDPVNLVRNRDHLRIYSADTMKRLLTGAGFTPILSHQDHRVENLLRAIQGIQPLERTPRLRSRIIGAVSLLLAALPGSEGWPFPGPYRNLAVIAKRK